MVQKKPQKSKPKANDKKSKAVPKKLTTAAVLNNGSSESEETRNSSEETESQAGSSNSNLGSTDKTDMPQGSKSVVNEGETSGVHEQLQKEKATTKSDKSKETVTEEKGEERIAVLKIKTVERQQKDKENKMEANEESITDAPKEDIPPIQQPTKSVKRKVECIESPPKVEQEVAIHPEDNVPSTSKSPKRKKKVAKTVPPKTKASQKKVKLCLPPLHSVSGKVFVIGENDVGQLGFGEEIEVKTRPTMLELPQSVVDIAAGGMHSVCLTESGEVITFGCNDEGALGRITTDEGSEYIPCKVEIPERVIQVSAGDSHSAALTESGQVYMWGNFRNGDGPMGLTADGSKQTTPIKILSGTTVVKISSGTEHLACLSDEGVVYTLGCGENGQLGRISERQPNGGRKGLLALLKPDKVSIMSKARSIRIQDVWTGSYSTFLKAQETGLIYAFGLNNYNQLGYEYEDEQTMRFSPIQVQSFNDKTWYHITGGQHHTLALDSDGLVYALGRKDYGRLGLGENCEVTSSPTVIPTLENISSSISCGNCVSFAITEGSVYSWGMGTNHQLGHGNDDDCHVPQRIEGNFQTSWSAYKVSGGGQHTLILACPSQSSTSD